MNKIKKEIVMNKIFRLIMCLFFLCLSLGAYANETDLDPVLYLSFDDEQKPMQDAVGNHEQIQPPETSRPKWIKNGKFGGAIEFDGKDDFWGIKDAADLNFGPNDSFTVELWTKINPIDSKAIATAIQKGNNTSSWDLRYHTKQRLAFIQRENGHLNYKTIMILWGNASEKWHHIAFVRDTVEKKLRFYVDGKLIHEKNETNDKSFETAGTPLYLGKDALNNKRFFRGVIDELAVFRGVKRYFDLSLKPVENVNSEKVNEYKPAVPKIEKPNPEIAKSWQELDKYKLNVVPAPKRLKVIGEPLPINSDAWVIEPHGDVFESGIELINKRLKLFKGKALKTTQRAAGKNRIIIGIYEALKDYLPEIGNPKRPPEQGYFIRNFVKDGKTNIVIAGSEKNGTLYGCVTLALLLKKGENLPLLYPVEIFDWPDFKYRAGYNLPQALNLQVSKKIIDYAFLAKQNVVYENSYYEYVKDMIAAAEKRKLIYDYAEARGIKIFLWQHACVGEAPKFDPVKMPGYSNMYYPYKTEEGLLADSHYSKGRAFTWCRDDLIDKRGRKLSTLLKKTGADILLLHSMDNGGRDNPGNWKYRTPMDEKRWGNDRAAAEANLMNRLNSAIKKDLPDAISIFVAYPYGSRYLQYPEIAEWLKRLSMLMDKNIYYCVREGTRTGMTKWMKATEPHPNFIYHEPWPWSYRLFFSCSGRYARTFYFKDRKKDIYLFASGSGIDMGYVFSPQIMVSAEYAWNTEAPGWGWFPKDSDSIPRADERVPEITRTLLPRVLAIFYGEKAAPYLAEAFKINLSGRLPGNLRQFNGASFLGYFKFKTKEGEMAVKKLEEAIEDVPPEAQDDFKQTLKVFCIAAKLNKVKYMQLEARDLLAENKLEKATKLMKKAKKELDLVKISGWLKRCWVTPIEKELNIADSVKWFRKKYEYLKRIKPEEIKVGVYNQGWYKGIIYALNKSGGIKTGIFEEPNTANMGVYDVIIFNACKNTGDVYGDWRGDLIKYVNNGRIAIFTHNAIGREPASSFGKPVFPEICKGFECQIMEEPVLTVKKDIDETIKAETKYQHEYFDHLTVKPGINAEILIVNKFNNPVMIGGEIGKGYVISTGEIFGLNKNDNDSDPKGDNWKMLFHMIRHAKKQCKN